MKAIKGNVKKAIQVGKSYFILEPENGVKELILIDTDRDHIIEYNKCAYHKYELSDYIYFGPDLDKKEIIAVIEDDEIARGISSLENHIFLLFIDIIRTIELGISSLDLTDDINRISFIGSIVAEHEYICSDDSLNCHFKFEYIKDYDTVGLVPEENFGYYRFNNSNLWITFKEECNTITAFHYVPDSSKEGED